FSLFSSTDEPERDEAQKKKDEMILLLKKAKLSMHRGNLQTASSFLHQAVALAHQTHNNQAIIYTYSQNIASTKPTRLCTRRQADGELQSDVPPNEPTTALGDLH
ncbi:Tetratricopeptide repeat protein 19, mitochondrial, partial [Ameca splendens]